MVSIIVYTDAPPMAVAFSTCFASMPKNSLSAPVCYSALDWLCLASNEDTNIKIPWQRNGRACLCGILHYLIYGWLGAHCTKGITLRNTWGISNSTFSNSRRAIVHTFPWLKWINMVWMVAVSNLPFRLNGSEGATKPNENAHLCAMCVYTCVCYFDPEHTVGCRQIPRIKILFKATSQEILSHWNTYLLSIRCGSVGSEVSHQPTGDISAFGLDASQACNKRYNNVLGERTSPWLFSWIANLCVYLAYRKIIGKCHRRHCSRLLKSTYSWLTLLFWGAVILNRLELGTTYNRIDIRCSIPLYS